MSRKPSQFARHPMSYTDARESRFFRAWCDHVVDGDTFDVLLDLGIGNYAYETIRLNGLDTPEINSGSVEDRLRGQAAQARTVELIAEKHVLVRTYRDAETFGRYVADVWWYHADGSWRSLAETLRVEGHIK